MEASEADRIVLALSSMIIYHVLWPRGRYLHDPIVSVAKLSGTWAEIVYATGELHADLLILEGDSAMMISWI